MAWTEVMALETGRTGTGLRDVVGLDMIGSNRFAKGWRGKIRAV